MRRRLLAYLACLSLCVPGSAAAQDGVFVDPDTPAGKEYAIPLEQARRDAGASGRPARVQPGVRSAPLFGEGIERLDGVTDDAPEGAREARRGGADARDRARRSEESTGTDAPDGAGSLAASEQEAHLPASSDSAQGSGDILIAGALGLGALGLGALAGAALRRRSEGQS